MALLGCGGGGGGGGSDLNDIAEFLSFDWVLGQARSGGTTGSGGTYTTPPPGVTDITPPVVTQVAPSNGAMDVMLDTQIVVTFNELIDDATINASSFIVKDAMGNVITGSIAVSNTSYAFTPDSLLDSDTSYTATITDAAEDVSGNNLINDYSWNFSTIYVLDPSSPVSLDPSALTDTSVTLNGSFTNPAGDTTTVWFEYGLTDAYGNSTPSAMYATDATIDHTADLSSLTNKTIYHYRIVTQNSMGVFYGEDKTFRTYISAVTLANNLNAPTSLHLHNNELYWVEVYDGDVMKISTSGGTAVIEASSTIAGNSATLVMDMTDLYWADWANIWMKQIGAGTVAPVATSLNLYDFYGLVEVYATDLYAMSGVGNTSNSIDKISISDGSVSQIITLPWYSRASIEVDATGVYWTNIPDAVIGKSQHDGSSEVTLAVGLNSPHSLILDSGTLYWAESNAIKSMSTSGGAITTIAENVSPLHMTKDSTNFYFAEEVGYPAYFDYYIKSVNISTGVVEVLSKIDLSSNDIRDIVVDDTYLYLLMAGNQYYPPLGKILKYEKSY